MSAAFRALGPSELLPRYVFAEPLLVRRRVLEVGAVASTGGESARFLRTRGARAVVACDDDVAAVTAAAAANEDAALRFRACVFEDLAPHSFDLLLVADLAPYVRAPGLLGALLRLRAPHGVLLGGLRNPAGFALSRLGALEGGEVPPTFGQALDALSAHLPSVEVATQAPVLGYQVAFERGDGLQVDGTLAGEGEAAYFVLVAGEGPVQGCEPVWVQLPPEPLAFAGGRLEAQEGRARQEQARARALAEALEAVRGELNALAAREQAQGQALASARAEVAQLVSRLDALERAAPGARGQDALSLRVRQLEQALAGAQAALSEVEAREELARAAEARAGEQAGEWAREVEAGRRREQVLAGQLREGLASLEAVHAERDALARKVEAAASSGEARATTDAVERGALRAQLEASAEQAAVAQERARLAEGRAVAAEEEARVLRLRVSGAEAQASGLQRRLAEVETEARAAQGRLVEALAESRRQAAAPAGAEGRGAALQRASLAEGLSAARPGPAGDSGAPRLAAAGTGIPPGRAGASPAVAGDVAAWGAEQTQLQRRVAELEGQLRERTRAYDALCRVREETEARFQNSEQALRALREALDAAARGR